jgi:hypothetical protein
MMDDVKRYGNNSQALHFLKTTHKKFGIPNPYEKLGRALWDWFTPLLGGYHKHPWASLEHH